MQISDDNLRAHVNRLGGDIGERNVFRPERLRAAQAYIETQWRRQGYTPAAQHYETHGVDCANLEVIRAGARADRACLVVGAHYDSVAGSPGADDNASGVAVLLELSRVLREAVPARSVRFVAFVNEEPPFFYWGKMGSKVYAEAARARGDRIELMLSLEMLGCYSSAPGSQRYPPLLRLFYPDRGNFIAFVSNLRSRHQLARTVDAFRACSDFPAERLATLSLVPGVGWSDHLSFWRQGYRALMVTDTAFYRYPYYHTAFDTPEKIDYPSLARVAEGLAASLKMLAGAG